MWRAACDEMDVYLFDTTRFFVFASNSKCEEKLEANCHRAKLEVVKHGGRCLSFELRKSDLDEKLLFMFRFMSKLEHSQTKITTTSGSVNVGFEAMARIVGLDIFIELFKTQWVRESVENAHYETWFQPIYDLQDANSRSAKPFAHEALFRLKDGEGEIVLPDRVFSLSDNREFQIALDYTARRSAIQHAAAARLDTKIFVNFDPSTISNATYCLYSTVESFLDAGLEANEVVFEVTETRKVRNVPKLKAALNYFRKAGFQIALDDVGSGWSGLNLLHELMPDYAKIDMDLIRGIDTSYSKQSFVSHLIASAQENGIQVIAEGVETQEEANCLQAFGVDFLQGFFFGKPELKRAVTA